MDIRKFFRSFTFAAAGVKQAWREQNFRFDIFAALIAVFLSIVTGLSQMEWIVVILLIALMLSLEMINTAIENVVDLASPDIHPLARAAKDIAAGAVFVFACASVIIGILIFLPKWMNL